MTITLFYFLLINLVSVSAGTFIANLAILRVINKRALAREKEQVKRIREWQKQATAKFTQEMDRRERYLKMEG